MNVVGAFMWVSVGATALHYWQGYMADHDQLGINPERTVNESVISLFCTKLLVNIVHFDSFNLMHFILIHIDRFGARFVMRTRRSIVCG